VIGKLLNIIKGDLGAFFVTKGISSPGLEVFSFPDLSRTGGQSDPILNPESLNIFLVNMEENRSHAPDEAWFHLSADGGRVAMHPPVKLDIYFLIAAKFRDYPSALDNLAACIQYFIANKYFDSNAHSDFPKEVEQVVVEMIPMTFEMQRAVWSSLQISYLPSALFRMGLLVSSTPKESKITPVVTELLAQTSQRS
jgi:hypothetical protein